MYPASRAELRRFSLLIGVYTVVVCKGRTNSKDKNTTQRPSKSKAPGRTDETVLSRRQNNPLNEVINNPLFL